MLQFFFCNISRIQKLVELYFVVNILEVHQNIEMFVFNGGTLDIFQKVFETLICMSWK